MQVPSYTSLLIRELSLPPERVATLSPDQEQGVCALLDEMLAHFGIANYTRGTSLDLVGEPGEEAPFPGTDEKAAASAEKTAGVPEVGFQSAPKTEPKTGLLDGGAGTGKTTILLTLLRRVVWMKNIPITVIAPTGKAASRVREVLRKDPDLLSLAESVCTMHSYLYGSPKEEACCPECKSWSALLAELPKVGDRVCPKCECVVPLFTPVDMRQTWVPGQGSIGLCTRQVLVVEEAGMLSKKHVADLKGVLSSQAYILFVGDQGQVEPIVEEAPDGVRDPYPWGVDFEHSTARLTQVHRLAAGNPVIAWATAVREGYVYKPMHHSTRPLPRGDSRLVFHDYCPLQMAIDWLVEHRRAGRSATLLCYTNKMRRQINSRVRAALGLSGVLAPDDLLVCRANGPLYMNGETFAVSDLSLTQAETFRGIGRKGPIDPGSEAVYRATVKGGVSALYILPRAVGEPLNLFRDAARDLVVTYNVLANHPDYQASPETLAKYGAIDIHLLVHVDYGQCLTTHMAQGSQWDHVGIVWEGACWGMWRNAQPSAIRWLYTAGTRAAISLTGFALEKQLP